MSQERLLQLLSEVARGDLTPEQALDRLRAFPIDELDYAQVDHLRPLSQGYPEVVLCEGKTVEQVIGICESLERESGTFLASRADEGIRTALADRFPGVEVNARARTVYLAPKEADTAGDRGLVLVVTAGTSDLPVAEEAVAVAQAMGNPVRLVADVGVAGSQLEA